MISNDMGRDKQWLPGTKPLGLRASGSYVHGVADEPSDSSQRFGTNRQRVRDARQPT